MFGLLANVLNYSYIALKKEQERNLEIRREQLAQENIVRPPPYPTAQYPAVPMPGKQQFTHF